jgi:hypothetical protein
MSHRLKSAAPSAALEKLPPCFHAPPSHSTPCAVAQCCSPPSPPGRQQRPRNTPTSTPTQGTTPPSCKPQQPYTHMHIPARPNLFLSARSMRSWLLPTPSRLSTTSTRCSRFLGPASDPSLVTWPTCGTHRGVFGGQRGGGRGGGDWRHWTL